MLGEHMLLSDEERRQQAVDSLHILDTPPDERIDRVTRLAQELFQVPMVSVTLIDRERQWRKSEIGLGVLKLRARILSVTRLSAEAEASSSKTLPRTVNSPPILSWPAILT